MERKPYLRKAKGNSLGLGEFFSCPLQTKFLVFSRDFEIAPFHFLSLFSSEIIIGNGFGFASFLYLNFMLYYLQLNLIFLIKSLSQVDIHLDENFFWCSFFQIQNRKEKFYKIYFKNFQSCKLFFKSVKCARCVSIFAVIWSNNLKIFRIFKVLLSCTIAM